jgi:AcrR family transcriptional regulator
VRTYSRDSDLIRRRREQIANVAIEIFYEKGFKGTNMRELSEACGLSPGAIYRYVGSKDDILHLICRNQVLTSDSLSHFVENLPEAGATETLCRCMSEYIRGCDQYRKLNTFFNREIHNFDREDRHMLLQSQVKIADIFEKILSRGIDTGEFRVEYPKFVGHCILMLGHDWGLRHWYLSQYFALEDYIRVVTKNILDMVNAGANQRKQAVRASIEDK